MDSVFELPAGLDRIRNVNLYPHQADGVSFLISSKRAILGDDMGLGKTRQSIAALEVAVPEGPVLVVCPASLKLNWRREIRLVDPEARIEIIGFDKEPVADARWVIVNYDLLGKHAERLRAIGWVGVILHQEQQQTNDALPQAAGRSGHSQGTALGSRICVPADRNADDKPTARSLQSPALRRPPIR